MRLAKLLPLLGLLALGYAKKCPRQRTSPGKEILCYTQSNDAHELEDAICRCTTLVHQGHELHNLTTAGIEELQKTLKESNPALQFVMSMTDPLETLTRSATTRQEALGRLANLLPEVDGFELDMSAGSKERLTHFMKGLRDEMVRKSIDKRIILTLPTETEQLAKQYDIKALAKYVDLFTLSTNYLADDSESFNAFHPSRLMGIFDMLNADSLIDLVSGLGIPKKKLLISLPASAYKFTLKEKEKNVPGSPVEEEKPEVISQKELCDLMSAGEWTVERDADLTAPYAFKDSTWIAYDDKTSVGIKGKYVLLRELAGLGVHEIENDLKNDCSKTITEEVYRSFTDMKRKTRGAVLASLENDLQHVEIPQSRHVRSSGYRIVRVVDTAGAIHAIRENTQTEFVCTRQGFFVHPKSCNRFYRCVKFDQGVDDFSVFEFDCPAGLAFDERTEVCVWPGSLTDGSPCPGSSEIAPVPRARFECPNQPGYYADPENCRWFFACFDLGEPEMRAYEFRCPFGLVFDEEKLICEWPWLVRGCGVSGSGYSRTEYGGSGYNVGLQGQGVGFGPGSANGGGAGYGDYIRGGIGGAGNYGPGIGGSAYTGSKGSESRPKFTIDGSHGLDGVQIGGQGIGGSGYSGSGAGGSDSGSRYPGSGSTGSRYSGSGSGGSGFPGAGDFGAGSAGSKYSGSGSGGSGFPVAGDFGAGSAGSKYSGSGSGGSGFPGAGDFGAGSAGAKYSGSGSGGLGFPGAGDFGAGSAGSKYSGSGSGGLGFNGAGDFGAGSKYPGSGSGGSGFNGAGVAGSEDFGAGLAGSKYSVSGSGGSGFPGAGDFGAGSAGSKYSGSGSGGAGFTGAGDSRAGSKYSGSGSRGSGYGSAGVTGAGYTGLGGSETGYNGAEGEKSGYSGGSGGYPGSGAGLSGKGGHSGTGYTGGISSGVGSTDSGYPGASVTYVGKGTSGSEYPGAGESDAGYQGAGEFGAKFVGSTGSGSGNNGYSGETASTGVYGGAGKPGVVIETVPFAHGYDSSIQHTGGAGSGFPASGGYPQPAGGNGGFTGFGSTITDHTGSGGIGQTVGKDGLVVSLETGGSPGAPGSRFTVNSGSGFGTQVGANKFSGEGNTGYTTSGAGAGAIDGHDVINGVSGFVPVISTGTAGSGTGGFSSAGNTGYAGSGENIFDGSDVINGGSNSGSRPTFTGVTGSTYSGAPQAGGIYTSGTGSKGRFSSVTKNTYTTPNPAFSIFNGKKSSVTPIPTVFLQTVTPGYSVTGSGIKSGVPYGGPFAGSEHTDDGTVVEGFDFGTRVTGSGNFLGNQPEAEGHAKDYNTGYVVAGPVEAGPGLNLVAGGAGKVGGSGPARTGSFSTVSNIGKGESSTGTRTDHGFGGVSNTFVSSKTTDANGDGLHGGFQTTGSQPGTVSSSDGDSGSVFYGKGNQGSIIGSTIRPGYVRTGSPAPGYVINGVTQSPYGQSTPGTFVTGTAVPNVVFTGTSAAPGIISQGISGPDYVITGQVNGEEDVRGSIGTGIGVTGTTTYHDNAGFSGFPTSGGKIDGSRYPGGAKGPFTGAGASIRGQDTGYQTNEYHDNGGRGTVTYNNGLSTNKYTESDLRPTYASVSDSDVSGGRIPGTGQVLRGNTLAGIDTSTGQGFTKTGPTRTGIITAQIGGTGSYVTNTDYRRPSFTSAGDNIGSKAFSGQDSNKGYSPGTSIGSSVNGLAYVTSTAAPDTSYVDTSKINLGYTSSVPSSGYSYKKPTVKFTTGSVTSSTPTPFSVTYREPIPPLTITTPSPPHLNIAVYNTPSIVTSAPITAAPAVVNTYTYSKPSGGHRRPSYQPSTVDTVSNFYNNKEPTLNVVYDNSGAIGQKTTGYRGPIGGQRQFTVSSTPAPIGYATKPADVYRTTLFEAAKLPVAVSTVAPVFDTGYKTIISSTPTPIAVTTGQYFYKDSRFDSGNGPAGQTFGNLDGTYNRPGSTYRKQFVSTTVAPDTENGYTYEKPAKKLTYNSPSTVTPSVTLYQQPKVTVEQQGEYIQVSTGAPGFDGSFRRPSASIRPALKQPTGSQGYEYSTYGVDSVTPTQETVYTVSQGYTNRGNGDSPAKLDISQDKVKELIGNYDRGDVKYTPNENADHDTFGTGFGSFGNKYSGNKAGFTSKPYVSSTPAPITYQSTIGYTSGSLGGSPGYAGGSFGPGIGSFDGSANFGNKYSGNKPSLTSKTYVSSTVAPISYQSTTGYPSGSLDGSSGYAGSSFGTGVDISDSIGGFGSKYSGNKPGLTSKTYVSSTVAPISYQSTTGYPSSSLGGSSGYRGSYSGAGVGISDSFGDLPSKYSGNKAGLVSKTYVSSTPAPTYQSTIGYTSGGLRDSSIHRGGYTYSTPLYEVSTAGPIVEKGKGKVIVKLSDLHPLLLGKLGAQCTCRSDPFQTLRGPGAKSFLIKSSKGNIDLANYDESQIYVDLEADREPEQSVSIYKTPNGSPTSAPSAYSSSYRTPVTAVFGLSTPAPTGYKSRGRPSTAYLPVSSTPSSASGSRGGSPDSQLSSQDSGAYGSPSDNSDTQFVAPPAGFDSGAGVPPGRSASGRGRSGKSSGGNRASGNAIGGEGAAFDRYGPGGWRNDDETLQGGVDCARSGIFRHPKYCNKFYACHWDEWKQKFTLHVFNCPVHLSFDSSAGACNWPTTGPACQDDNLLV